MRKQKRQKPNPIPAATWQGGRGDLCEALGLPCQTTRFSKNGYAACAPSDVNYKKCAARGLCAQLDNSDGGPALRNATNFLKALSFAARKHRHQRRKDAQASPYINHPIAVATVLADEGGVTDESTLMAAALHDTVEDTQTTFAELEKHFGSEVTGLVRELTDDNSLEKSERKRLQIEHAPDASMRAKELKIADKICNIRDITDSPPADWSMQRRREYVAWSEQVVAGCRGANSRLDDAFARAVLRAKSVLVLKK